MDLGDQVPLSIEVRNESGALANASVVGLTITGPDGTTYTPTILPSSTGVYKANFTPTQLGRHTVRWTTANPQAAFTDVFDVRDVSARSIVPLNEAKLHLNMNLNTTGEDEEIRGILEAVTYAIERHVNKIIPLTTFSETLWTTTGTGAIQLDHYPVNRIVAVNHGLTAYDEDQWVVDHDSGVIYGPRLASGDVITYQAGYPLIPAHYVLAAKITLAHIWQTQRMPTVGPQSGFGLRNQAGSEPIMTASGLGNALPQRAIELLGPRPSMIV